MFQRATGNHRHPMLIKAIPKLSKPQIDNYIYRLNDAFIGTATFSFENNMVNFIFNLQEVIVPASK